MEKNYNILKKYILYFIVFALVCLVGISNCFALTNNQSISFYDNNGSSLSSVSTSYIQQIDQSNAIFTTTTNSYGGAVMIQANTSLIQNHIYTLFINVGAESNGGFTILSTKNCIGLGNNYANAINSYINCSITPKYSQPSGVTTDKGRGIYFSFVANTNGNYILVPYTTQYTCTNCNQYSFGFNLDDGGDTTGLTQQQVNNLISNQTTIIQNEISNMQQDISGSIDDMKDSINDNIDKNLNSCRDSINLLPNNGTTSTINGITFTINNDKSITMNGTSTAVANFRIFGTSWSDTSNVINLNNGISYTISKGTQNAIIYVRDAINNINTETPLNGIRTFNNMSKITYVYIQVQSGKTLNNETIYPMIEKGTSASQYEEHGKNVCENKLDTAETTRKGILGKIKDLFNLFNSDDIGDSADDGADFINDFNTNTFGLTSIVTAPLNLIQSLTSSSCTELRLPLPYLNNKFLILPCMTSIYSQYFGSFFTMYQTITYGIIAYWVIVRIFNQVKDFKNPEHDEIEVVDL